MDEKTSLQEAWATCHRGDWMMWLSFQAVGPAWSSRDYLRLWDLWNDFVREHHIDTAHHRRTGGT